MGRGGERVSNYLKQMIEEIENALESELYLAALTMTLILPDICSKLEYPSITKTGERYKKWLADRIDIDYPTGIRENNQIIVDYSEFEHLTSEKIYKLRNNVFHESSPEYESRDENVTYELLWKNQRIGISRSSILTSGSGLEMRVTKSVRVNVHDLCLRILSHAKTYIE